MKGIRITNSPLPSNFIWVGSGGIEYRVGEMSTSHLFNVVRMIWNHTMPESMQVYGGRYSSFPPIHTDKYWEEALRHMVPELARRDNLSIYQHRQLMKMIGYLSSDRIEELIGEEV